MAARTNAVRQLEQAGIRFELREYVVDPTDLSAETVAAKVGLPAEQVFKTLACRGERNGVLLAVVPGNYELNLKLMAQAAGERKVEMLPLKEVQAATGYIRGAVTALACRKPYPVWIDETAELHEVISVSAGMRGLQILLAPGDYIRVTEARRADIAREKA